jgi:hypothetical protein
VSLVLRRRKKNRELVIDSKSKSPPRRGFFLRNFFDEAGKSCRRFFGKLGEHLAIDQHFIFSECADELAVRELALYPFESRVDADIPQAAKVILFITAVSKRIFARVEDCLFGRALFLAAGKAIALYLGEDIFAALITRFAYYSFCLL